MATRRKTPADYAAVKRSRAGFTGSITKAADKIKAIKADEPATIALINPNDISKILKTIKRTEDGFLLSMEDAHEFSPEGEAEEAFYEEEEAVLEAFTDSLTAVRVQADKLLKLSSILTGLSDLTSDIKAIETSLAEDPRSVHSTSLQSLETSFSKLRLTRREANLPKEHPLKGELDAGKKTLMNLTARIVHTEHAKDHSPPDASITSSVFRPEREGGKLPPIALPTFKGDLLQWSTFWQKFSDSVDKREHLSATTKLTYLRQAVQDPAVQTLLNSPTEGPDTYQQLVQALHKRYERTRKIHRDLVGLVMKMPDAKNTSSDLRKLVDEATSYIGSIKQTGHFTLETFLTSVIYSRLPYKVRLDWDDHHTEEKVAPYTELMEFISNRAYSLADNQPTSSRSEPTEGAHSKGSEKKATPHHRGSHKPHANAASTPTSSSSSTYKWECFLCKPEKHPIHTCPKWANLTVPQRLGHVRNKNLCNNCLGGGHSLATCKSTYRCRTCGQQHHTTLHQESAAAPPVNSARSNSHQVPEALMTTAQVLLVGPRGQELKARALIDSGASLSIISNKIAQTLGLPLTPSKLCFSGVQGTTGKPVKHFTTLTVSPLLNRGKKIQCHPAVVPLVTADFPAGKLEPVHGMDHLIGLHLADPDYNIPGKIDILFGADLAPQIMTKRMLRTGADTEPMAQATEFGWVLSGPATRSEPAVVVHSANHNCIQPEVPPLTDLVQEFWNTEELPGDDEPCLTEQEKQVEAHYEAHTTYSAADCRYEVTLPRRTELFPLGDSKGQATSRFLTTEVSNAKKKTSEPFQAGVQQYVDKEYAEKVPPSEPPPTDSFHLPMHAVYKESSSSTKLRIVFDGSAITTSGVSLNQALKVGPTLQPKLSETLLKFRCYPIALNADISKMYSQVALSPADRDLHRFIWRASPSEPLSEYRMCRVTFGVSASPYLAVKTLQRTARDHGGDYPSATHHILHSFYVDDFLGGADSTQEAVQLFHQLREVLLKGGFNLTKWRSSSKEVLQQIPAELQEPTLIKDFTSMQSPTISKALGLVWDADRDVMSPAINVSPTYTTTKRGIYRDVSKTYDVLGWIAPTVILMKILFQSLWKAKTDWDEQVPPDLLAHHALWREELPQLKQRSIPRCYILPHLTPITTELHAFCDASMKAYGAVVYCRTTYREHAPVITLVTSKTKVAKIDAPTVPRLELCGAVLLTQLLISTAKTLNISSEHWHAWTDSSIVLAWLDGQPRQFMQYVANRVSFILQATTPQHWQHVPTKENPADCCSRGLMPSELLHFSLWWEGPTWLHQDPVPVPHQPPRRTLQPLEMKVVHLTIPYSSVVTQIQQRTSSYHSTLAIVAWCLRLRDRLKLGRPNPDNRTRHLTGLEVIRARDWILRENQSHNFPKEKHALEKGQAIPPTSRLRALNPLLDSTQLLRVGGRLANSALSYSQQHPVIADSKDAIIQKWFQHIHISLCHCGPSLLLSYAGTHLHILGARRLSRAVCSQCTTCRRVAPKWTTQLMGDLPSQSSLLSEPSSILAWTLPAHLKSRWAM